MLLANGTKGNRQGGGRSRTTGAEGTRLHKRGLRERGRGGAGRAGRRRVSLTARGILPPRSEDNENSVRRSIQAVSTSGPEGRQRRHCDRGAQAEPEVTRAAQPRCPPLRLPAWIIPQSSRPACLSSTFAWPVRRLHGPKNCKVAEPCVTSGVRQCLEGLHPHGNTVQVCIAHYLHFIQVDSEMLWNSA
jgi:hypothetical protein